MNGEEEKAFDELKAQNFGLAARLQHTESQLTEERAFSKKVGEEIMDLRNRVLGVWHDSGPDGRLVCFQMRVDRFFNLHGNEQREYLTEAVLDALRRLLHEASGAAHLDAIREKLRAKK